MKKILVVLALAAFVVGCIPKPPDIEGIKDLLEKDLQVVVTPEDDSVTIEITGFPAELPEGLEGISIYLSSTDTMGGVPGSELGVPIVSGLTSDTILGEAGLANGTKYYYEGRGEITGDTISEMGFGGRFYPRPWGAGSYLGYNPESDPPDQQNNNALFFERETGRPFENQTASSDVDFFFFMEGTNLYITNAKVLGGTEFNGIEPAGVHISNWLDVQDSSTIYSDTVELKDGLVYHFMTADGYYGKFAVQDMDMPAFLGEGDAITVYLRYAFQTKKHIGHY